MKAFAALLDRLVYTPSRNGKLRLLGDYFAAHARPGPRLGAGGADRRADLRRGQGRDHPQPGDRAGRRGAVRLVLRLCRRPGRDRGADLAAKPGANREPTHGRGGRDAARPPRARASPLLVERWLDALDAVGRWALLKLITGGAAGRRLGAAGQGGAGGMRAASRSTRSRRSGTRWSRPMRSCSPGCRGQGPKPEIGDRAGLPAADAGASAGGRGHRRARPGRLSGRVEMGRHPGAAGRPRRPAAADLLAHRRRHHRRLSRDLATRCTSRPCSTASCWWRGTGSVAPFNDLQQRLNRKTVSARMLAEYPAWRAALRHPVRRRGGSAAAAVRRAPRAAGGLVRRRAAAAHGPVAADPVRELGRAGGAARRRPGRRRSKG